MDNELLETAGKLLESWKASRGETKTDDDELDDFSRWLKQPVNPIEHPVGPGSGSPSSPNLAPGWKSGYWSKPGIEQIVQGKAFSGLTVPSLTGGIVSLGDRQLSLLDVIPRTPWWERIPTHI
jgi:hypothetical protein